MAASYSITRRSTGPLGAVLIMTSSAASAGTQPLLDAALMICRELSEDRQYPVDPMRRLLCFRRMNFHIGHQLFVRYGAGDFRRLSPWRKRKASHVYLSTGGVTS